MKKVFICFLLVSFLLTVCGFHDLLAGGRVIGEVVSSGGVRFGFSGQLRSMGSSSAPVVEGMRIAAEDGAAAIVFTSGVRLEMKPSALVRVEHEERVLLEKGGLGFRIPSFSGFVIKAGGFTVMRGRVLQASRSISGVPSGVDVVGFVGIGSDGVLVVESVSGELRVLDESQRVVASLSAGDRFGFPSRSGMVAQVGEIGPRKVVGEVVNESSGFLGLSGLVWGGIVTVAAVIGVVIGIESGRDHERRPICP